MELTVTMAQERQRRLWWLLTKNPGATYHSMMWMLGYYTKSTLKHDLDALRAVGYIDWDEGRLMSRRVLVPFGEGTVRVSERVAA